MKTFLKNIALFSILIWVMLIYYIICDPYMVVWQYDSYFPHLTETGFLQRHRKELNMCHLGVKTLERYNDSVHYDSYIIGSSRSQFYYIEDWQKYIGDSARCFHFNSSNDNLYGTIKRLEYLLAKYEVKNLLLIVDFEYFYSVQPHTSVLQRMSYHVDGDWPGFHYAFLKAFFTLDGQREFWTNEAYDGTQYCELWNEAYKVEAEHLLDTAPEQYWNNMPANTHLYERSGEYKEHDPMITGIQLERVKYLAALLKEYGIQYRIISGPMYDQISFNKQDLKILEDEFGKENVFDFSGINDLTNDPTNYYEPLHYRPKACNKMMEVVYRGTE